MSQNKISYKKLFIGIFSFFIILYFIIWILSSVVIKHFMEEPLKEQGLTLSENTYIGYNPFLTKILIENFTLLKEDKVVFSADQLTLQLALHKLLFDKVKIEEFMIQGVILEVEKVGDKLIVAGIDLNAAKTIEPKTEENPNSEPLPYIVNVDVLTLLNAKVNISIDGNIHQVSINELLVSDVNASQLAQSAQIKLTSTVDDASVKLSANVDLKNDEGNISSNTEINEYLLTKIKHFIPDVNSLNGKLSFSSKQTINLKKNTVNVNVEKAQLLTHDIDIQAPNNAMNFEQLTLKLNDVELSVIDNNLIDIKGVTQLLLVNTQVNTQDNTIRLDELSYSIDELLVSLAHNNLTNIKSTSQLSLTNALIKATDQKQNILGFKQLTLNNISPYLISTSTSNSANENILLPETSIGSLVIDDLVFSHNENIDLPPLTTLKQFTLENIVGSQHSLSIDNVNIDSITSHIILNQKKALANLVQLTPEKSEDLNKTTNVKVIETTEPSENTQPTTPFYVTVKAINVINNNQIDFIDNSVDPIYKRSLMIDKLMVGSLSNLESNKEFKTPVTLKGRSNQYANFSFEGFIQPFAKQKTYHLKGNLNELSLPDVSTYMKEALKLELTSGQLNTALDVTLIDDGIKGDINFNIQGLETTTADNHETGTVKSQVGIPLNAALGMLKDGKGNIELDIPLFGKTSSPTFGISSFIALITKKAVMSATQSYLMKTFVPYANVVSVAMSAGEFILKLRFEDFIYEPTKVTFNEQQTQYLAQFIGVMNSQENTQVKICAISVPADLGLTLTDELSKESIKKLKDLGDERERTFKAHVVEQGKIKSGRILLCTPRIDTSEGALARIEISV